MDHRKIAALLAVLALPLAAAPVAGAQTTTDPCAVWQPGAGQWQEPPAQGTGPEWQPDANDWQEPPAQGTGPEWQPSAGACGAAPDGTPGTRPAPEQGSELAPITALRRLFG